MELSKNQANKYRFENEITIPEFILKNMITEFEEVEVQEKLDKMRLDVDISITKGENLYRNNETERIKKTYNGFAPLSFFFINIFFLENSKKITSPASRHLFIPLVPGLNV
jgi:hypothetical protein